jgi:phospholipase/carboxylesterase
VISNPHRTLPLETAGAQFASTTVAIAMLHGRGQTPGYMREHVYDRLDRLDLAYILPQAYDHSWYPASFLAPAEQNEPLLSHALQRIEDVRSRLEEEGIEDGRIIWLGFSQGACLAAEYVARSAHRFGGLVCFTGGLVGASEPDLTRPRNVLGLPVLLAAPDADEFVPLGRVQETAAIFRSAGAVVELAVSRGSAHEIIDDSIERCGRLISRVEDGISHPG